MATSLTSVVTTALRFSSALSRLARAASVARRNRPQISTSNESRLSVASPKVRFCDGTNDAGSGSCPSRESRVVVRFAADADIAEIGWSA